MEGDRTQRPAQNPEDEQWRVERAKRDPEAFGELYDTYFDRIYAYISRKVNDRQATEDLTSDTFMKAFAAIKTYRYTGQPFVAWLYRIAANVVIDYYRKQHIDIPMDDGLQIADRGTSPEEAALRLDDQQAVARAIQTLSPDQQDVILLRFSEDMKLKDIGKVIGKTEGAVKALMFRALNSLRVKLTEGGDRP